MKKTLLILLLPLSIYAQRIERKDSLTYTDFPNTQFKPELVGVDFDPATQSLKLYGWQQLIGDLKQSGNKTVSIEEPPKKKGLMGALNKVANATNSISIKTGNDSYTSLPLLTTRTIDVSQWKTIDSQREVIAVYPINPNQNYQWIKDDRHDGRVVGLPSSMPIQTDLSHLSDKFPGLYKTFSLTTKAGFEQEGEGMLGLKNRHTVLTIQQPSLKTEQASGRLVVGWDSNKPNQETIARELGQLTATTTIIQLPQKPSFLALMQVPDKDDSWAMYKHYKLIQFDTTGTIQQQIDLPFEYLRQLHTVQTVYDANGQPGGHLFVFGSMLTIGGKKHRDPVENHYSLVFIDSNGALKFNYIIAHGDPEKSRGFRPFLVVKKDDQLQLLSYNSDKIFKESVEKIVLNDKGIVSTSKAELADAKLDTKLFKATSGQVKFINNQFWLINQDTPPSGVGDKPQEYGNANIATISPDLTIQSFTTLPIPTSTQPMLLKQISNGNEPTFVLSTPQGNRIITFGTQVSDVNVTPKRLTIPAQLISRPNYAFDSAKQKIYFVYEKDQTQAQIVITEIAL